MNELHRIAKINQIDINDISGNITQNLDMNGFNIVNISELNFFQNSGTLTGNISIKGNTNIVGNINITGQYLVNGNPFTATPGGNDKQLQFNNNGTLAGIPDVTYGAIDTPIGPINGLQASFINVTNTLYINEGAELVADGSIQANGGITGPDVIMIGSSINVHGDVTGYGANFQIGRFYDAEVSRNLWVGGSFAANIKNAIVKTQNYGTRLTYCMEAATVRFYDEGKDTLVNGEKRIDLDPIFLETIEGELYIHVTPYGPASLYISEKGTNYFVVKSMQGNDVEFNWIVSAIRKGYTGIRLEEFKR
jgi:hypothetical protein